jgi:ABC-type transport system involved in multi-copper enzyme maturation permease subunit
MSELISLPVARAAARERGIAPLTMVIVVVLVMLGLVRGSMDQFGAEAFSGFAGAWFFILTMLLGAGLLADEVESGHAQLVLLRPLTRAQWVGGRFLGAAFVLCAAGTAGWAGSFAAAMSRGATDEIGARLLVLPLALLPALGWLATLLAIGAVARGWTNAGILIAARLGWVLLKFALPFALPKWGLQPWLEAIDRYYGPQETLMIARQVHYHERLVLSPALWDVLWILAAWLVALRLFNLRELARRRA